MADQFVRDQHRLIALTYISEQKQSGIIEGSKT